MKVTKLLDKWLTVWGIAALLCSTLPCQGQIEDPSAGELLENFFRENEQASEADAQLLLETLENLRQHPLDLNAVGREDLLSIRLLNEIQIENFLAYRTQFGPLLNEYELQAIPAWELSDIRRLLPFVRVATGLATRNRPLYQGFTRGENELILRWGRDDRPNFPVSAEGRPDAIALRFRHSFDNRLRFGFTAEKDPGEAFFRGSNREGFDFYSGHFFIQQAGPVLKTLALGDFSARFGQGLLLQTSFSPGKSAETMSVARDARKINAYAAFGEAFFLRGAATTLAFGNNWEVTGLLSNRRRDANVLAPIDTIDQDFADLAFTSLQTSGLHRTPSEIEDEKAIREWVGGLSVTRRGRNGQFSLNGVHLAYDKSWQPAEAPYRRFVFAGKRLTGLSADYNWRHRNWYLFGEAARSDNGGLSVLNGLLFAADRRVTLALLHRALGREYQSVYAAPFAETSGASNEQGVYLGADIRFGRKWQINTYADVWRHPWLRFGVNAPSKGSEYLGRLIWTPKRGVSFYALWQLEIKERNAIDGPGLAENRRGRFRLHGAYKISPAVELRSRVEWSSFREGRLPRSRGFLAYQEAVVRPMGSPVYGALRYVVFDTRDFDTRLYAFENDLFAALSIPAFAGRGSRYYINLTWRVNKWLRLESRLEQTITKRAATESGVTGRETGWKFQAQLRF